MEFLNIIYGKKRDGVKVTAKIVMDKILKGTEPQDFLPRRVYCKHRRSIETEAKANCHRCFLGENCRTHGFY